MIGTKVKDILEEKKMSQYRLAKITNLSASYISEMISGKYKNPSMKVLKILSKALGTSVTKLMKD